MIQRWFFFFLVYQLSQESTQIGDECPICFEEFEEGKPSRCVCSVMRCTANDKDLNRR